EGLGVNQMQRFLVKDRSVLDEHGNIIVALGRAAIIDNHRIAYEFAGHDLTTAHLRDVRDRLVEGKEGRHAAERVDFDVLAVAAILAENGDAKRREFDSTVPRHFDVLARDHDAL